MNYSRFSLISSVTFAAVILTTQVFAADLPLPRVTTQLSGKMAHEALLEVLKIENIPQMLAKFKPIQEGLEWTPHPLRTEREVSTLHLSFRRVEIPAQEEQVNRGLWGYFKGAVSSTVSAVTNVASSLIANGDFIAEVRRNDLSSARNVEGFRLDMEFNRSSLAISSLITHFSTEITFTDSGTPEAPFIQVELESAMQPGMMFPGMQDPYVGPFIQTQLTAWAEAVKEAALEQQARLLSLSREN